MLIQGCYGATIGKAKQAAKTEIEKIKVWHLIMFILYFFLFESKVWSIIMTHFCLLLYY